MKITKSYLQQVIKEELQMLKETNQLNNYGPFEQWGKVLFNQKFVDNANEVQVEEISKLLSQLKPNKKITVVMIPDGSLYSQVEGEEIKAIVKGGPNKEQIITNYFEALMRAVTNIRNQANPVSFQRPQAPQQKQASTTPPKWDPSMGVMKPV